MTVYVVTHGDYSDYSVDAVCSTSEKAKEYMDRFPKTGYGGYNDVEKYELDPADRYIRDGVYPFFVLMTKDGDTLNIHKDDHPHPGDEKFLLHPAYGKHPERMSALVDATDETHAVKIANEIRTQLIATEQWQKEMPHK